MRWPQAELSFASGRAMNLNLLLLEYFIDKMVRFVVKHPGGNLNKFPSRNSSFFVKPI
jgi:hypothetical protein